MSTLEVLLERARAAQAAAYAPYSRYGVGAALLTQGGALFVGCNVENAAYPVGTCAEQSAIAAMVAAGQQRIAAIVAVGPSLEPIAPCGACRQRIGEFGDETTRIYLAEEGGTVVCVALPALLPRAFGPAQLAARRSPENTPP